MATKIEEADKHKKEGNEYFQNKEYEKSIECFTNAIECIPDDAVLYSNRSGAFLSIQKPQEALQDAEKAVQLRPEWVKAYSRKGAALLMLKKTKEAQEAYEAGLKLDPTNAACKEALKDITQWEDKGLDMEIMSRILEVMQCDQKVKEHLTADPNYLTELMTALKEQSRAPQDQQGSLFLQQSPRIQDGINAYLGLSKPSPPAKKKCEAKSAAPKVVEKTFDTEEERKADEYKTIGNTHYKKKEFSEALAAYEKALEYTPNEILLYNNKAAVYLEKGEYAECIKICEDAVERRHELNSTFAKIAKVYNRMASCYVKEEKYQQAIEMYEKALLEDNDRHTRNALRDIKRIAEKKEKEALIDPVLSEKHKAKGNEFFKEGDFPAAKKEYDEAILRSPENATLYSNRSAALNKLGDFPSALHDVDRALELDPKFVKCWIRKGNLHFLMKENHKAMEAYDKACLLDPTNQEAKTGQHKVMSKIQQTNQSSEIDEEQYRHAMADPEIQQILGDPQFQMILKKITENPSLLQSYLKDPKIASGISKLMSAGILRAA